jgi:hypothetical protein
VRHVRSMTVLYHHVCSLAVRKKSPDALQCRNALLQNRLRATSFGILDPVMPHSLVDFDLHLSCQRQKDVLSFLLEIARKRVNSIHAVSIGHQAVFSNQYRCAGRLCELREAQVFT